MKLKELLKNIKLISPDDSLDFEVKGITSNSKEVREGFIFVAIKGFVCDGNDVIKEAIKNGTKLVITQSPVSSYAPKSVSFIKVKNPRDLLWQLAAKFYSYPSKEIKCIGVTGTNGKTTVSYLLEAIFSQAKYRCGLCGTINYRFSNKLIPASATTPGAVFLQSMIRQMVDEHLDYFFLEVSSHSLDQQRIGGIDFRYAIFTNLTSEHLDYHKDEFSYFKAKEKLFKMLDKDSYAVINIDDKMAGKLSEATKAHVLTYGVKKTCGIKAEDLKFNIEATEFNIKAKEGNIHIRTKLLGMHNVYNILAAAAVALSEGIVLEDIAEGVYNLDRVPGRLELVRGDYPFKVFVDYAHTEDALRNVLLTLVNFKKNKVIVVFGCGGGRDQMKRPVMGKVAASLADIVVVTSDNPRSENPQYIIENILSGIKKANAKIEIIPERYSAIEKALSLADRGDIVLIAGKGHEGYQILKDKKILFDDREAAVELLSKKYNMIV